MEQQRHLNIVCVCDHCDASTAQWFCMSDGVFLCDRCDIEIHSNRIAARHYRVPYTQSPDWAYQEAKSKGRLREGVGLGPPVPPLPRGVPPKSLDSSGIDHAGVNRVGGGANTWQMLSQQSSQLDMSASTHHMASANASYKQQATQSLDAGGSMHGGSQGELSLFGRFDERIQFQGMTNQQANNSQQQQQQQQQSTHQNGAYYSLDSYMESTHSTQQCSTCIPRSNGQLSHQQRANGSMFPGSFQSSEPMDMQPRQTSGVNQHLVSMMEEFRLPDGSADSFLLDLPPSPPSVSQQPVLGGAESMFMDMRQHGPAVGSLKSSSTTLTNMAMQANGNENTNANNSNVTSPQQPQNNNLQMQAPTANSGMGALASMTTSDKNSSSTSYAGLWQQQLQTQQQQSQQPQQQPIVRGAIAGAAADMSNNHTYPSLFSPGMMSSLPPMPIAGALNNFGTSSGAATIQTAQPQPSLPNGESLLVRGLMAGGSLDTLGNSLLRQCSTQSEVFPGNKAANSLAALITPDNSLHGSGAAASLLAGGQVGSIDDTTMLANSLMATSAPPVSTLPSSLLASVQAASRGLRMGLPLRPSSLFVEAASAASIEARARALINSSSRTPQTTVHDPNIVTRIEKPDGTVKELDPERAAQLHRYRQKRLARMKAYAEGQKKVRYECRKQLADSRLRVRGRFAKVGSYDNLTMLQSCDLGSFSSFGSLGSMDQETSQRGATNAYAALMHNASIDEERAYDKVTTLQRNDTLQRSGSNQLTATKPNQPRGCASEHVPQQPRQSLLHSSAPLPVVSGTSDDVTRSHSSFAQNVSKQTDSNMDCQLSADAIADQALFGPDLDAAILEACEQEALTVTDQELAALGFNLASGNDKVTSPGASEGSAESMTVAAPSPVKGHPNTSRHDAPQPQQTHQGTNPNGACSQLAPYSDLGVGSSFNAGDFSDHQVASMLDELLQEQCPLSGFVI